MGGVDDPRPDLQRLYKAGPAFLTRVNLEGVQIAGIRSFQVVRLHRPS